MNLTIKNEDQTFFNGEIKQDSITIGRGSSCDIRCKVEGISRQHLEIKRSGDQAQVKLLTGTNWALLDQTKIDPNVYYPFLSFNELTLPGDISVSIQFENDLELESANSTGEFKVNTSIKSINSNLNARRISTPAQKTQSKKETKEKGEAREKLPPKYVAMAAFTALFWIYYGLTSKIPFLD